MPDQIDDQLLPPPPRKNQNSDGLLPPPPKKKQKNGGIKWGRGSEDSNAQLESFGKGLGEIAAKVSKTPQKEKFKPEDISVYNKNFEQFTGHSPLNLSEPTKPTNILEEDRYQKKKQDFERGKFLEYRKIENNQINPVLNNVQRSMVTGDELKRLHDNPFGKNIVKSLVPEGADFEQAAHELNVKNRPNAVYENNQELVRLDKELADDIGTYYVSSVNTSGGSGGYGSGSISTTKLPTIDTNSPEQIGRVISMLEISDGITDSGGRIMPGVKEEMLKKLQAKSFWLNVDKVMHNEIFGNKDKIAEAVTRFNIDRERGEKGTFGKNDEENVQHFMLGLNLIKDERPGTYQNIMRAINERGKIADTDMEMVAGIGQDLYNARLFNEGAYNPDAVGKETAIDYKSYQTKRAEISRAISEHPIIKRLSRGFGEVPGSAIEKAANELGIENKEIVNDIKLDEANGGTGIVKTGKTASFLRGVAQPFKGIQSTVNALTQSPVDTYLNSKRFDYGDQQVSDSKGNYRDVLPGERENVFNIAAEGLGQFMSQVLFAKSLGKVGIKNPYAQTFPSILAQTYGDSYAYFLDKTGSPSTARLAGTVDAVATSGFELIMPDVKIADDAKKLIAGQSKKLANDIVEIVTKGESKNISSPIKNYVGSVLKIIGKENIEELATNYENYINEAITSPITVKDRDLVNELGQTAKATTFAMAIPGLLGATGKGRGNQAFTKDALSSAAINFQEYKSALEDALANNQITSQEYNDAIGVLEIQKSSIDNAPKRDANGDVISSARQLEYAYQNTVSEINTTLSNRTSDKVQKEPYEKKIEEADNIKRKIFYGEEVKSLPKEEEDIQPIVDEQNSLLETLRSKAGELEQKMDMEYFQTKASEDPNKYIEKYGEDVVMKLIENVPTETLKSNLDMFLEVDAHDHPSVKILDDLITQREQSGNPPIDQVRELADENTPDEVSAEQPTPVNIESNEQGGKVKGSKEVYDSNEGIKRIGTEKEYDDYLDSIFPESKVKEIVYHGTDAEFDKFNDSPTGISFATDKSHAQRQGKNVVAALVNLKNPETSKGLPELKSLMLSGKDIKDYKEHDGFYSDESTGGLTKEANVARSEQVHILGSKSDIEGFKKWKQKNETTTPQPTKEDKQVTPIPSSEQGGKESVTWNNSGTKFNDKNEFKTKDGRLLSIESVRDGDNISISVKDSNREFKGKVTFSKNEDGTYSASKDMAFSSEKGVGIGRAMYDFVQKTFGEIKRQDNQTKEGASFWDKNKKNETTTQESNKEDKGKIGDEARALAAKIRAGKISKLGGLKSSTGFEAIWDGTLEVIAKAIEAGASVADAVQKGIRYMQERDFTFNHIHDFRIKAINKMNAHALKKLADKERIGFKYVVIDFLNWVKGGVAKFGNLVKDYAKIVLTSISLVTAPNSVQVNNAVKSIQQETKQNPNVQKIKDLINRDYSQNGETPPQDVINRALYLWDAVGRPDINIDTPKVSSFVRNDTIHRTIQKSRAFAEQDKNSISNINDIHDLIAELSHSLQFVSGADLDFGKQIEQDEYDSIEYERKGSVEYDAHKIIEPILFNYLLTGQTGDNLFSTTGFENTKVSDLVKSTVEKYIPSDDKNVKEKGKYIADLLRKGKIKTTNVQSNIAGIPIAIYNSALEVVATAVEGGAKLINAIQQGIAYIKSNHNGKFDEEDFEKRVNNLANSEPNKSSNQSSEEAGVVDEGAGKESQPAEEKPKFSTKARDLAAKIREKGLREALPNWAKADLPEGTQIKGFGGKFLDEAVAKAIELVADAYDATGNLADAIKEGYAHLKDYYTQNTKSFNEEKVRKDFEANMNAIFSEDEGTKEPPPAEEAPKKKGRNDKGILTHLHDAANVPQAAKDGFKSEGLKYETKSQKEAESVAKSVIDFAGIDEAVKMAESQTFDGDVNSLIFAEALNQLADQEQKATTPEAKLEAAKRFAEVGIAYDKMARYGGRFNAAINYFYQKSPLGIVMMENANRKDDFSQWAKGKNQSWKEFYDQMMKEPDFAAIVNDQIKEGLKKERAEKRKERTAKVDKFFDDAIDKTKGGAAYATIIPTSVVRAALEGMRKAYHAGEAINAVIQDAIDYISDQLGTTAWDSDKFRKEWEDKLAEKVNAEELYRQRLRAQIKDLDEQISNRKRKPKEPKEEKEYEDETKKLIEERDKKRALLDQIVAPQDRLDRYKASLKRQIDELNEQIKEKKRKSPNPKSEPDAEATALAAERDKLKEELERVAPLKSTDDYKIRQLDKVRKKLKGLTESQKDEVIRSSHKELIENGALSEDDFKKIIARVTGRGELTPEEVAKMKESVEKINAVDDAAKKWRTEKTKAAEVEYRKAQIEATKATRDLNDMFQDKPDIVRRLVSMMQLNTLVVVSLIANVTYNFWNQSFTRFPIGVINSLFDLGKTAFDKNYEREFSTIENQKSFWKSLGVGAKEAMQQIGTGLNRQDYLSKEIPSQFRPFKSARELLAWKRGKKNLTKAQVWDRILQAMPQGMAAEAVARLLNVGDKPQRFGAEGAQAAAFAKALGLKGVDRDLFIEFPREQAYEAYKAQGLSDEIAGQKADYVKEAIIQEGKRSTFQQDNLLNDAITRAAGVLPGGKDAGVAGLAKTLTISPYIKIPTNAFWSMYNLVNPEVALLQSVTHAGIANRLKKKGEITKSKLQTREARYWMAHALWGMGLRAIILSLVKAGVFVPSSDDDESKKERDANNLFDKPGYVNVGDVKISNRWFGVLGAMGNVIAKKERDMTPEQRENQDTFWNTILGLQELSTLKEMENGVFANSSSLLQSLGSGDFSRYGINSINLFANILQPATSAQFDRAQLDYVPSSKGDNFLDKLNQNFANRSKLYRRIFDVQVRQKRDIWGQPIPKGGNELSRMFGISKANPQVFGRPIYNDFIKTGDSGFLPPAVLPILNGMPLNTEQENRLIEYVGAERKKIAEPYANDQAQIKGFNLKYSELDDEDKKFVLQYLYQQGREFGLEKFYEDYPEFRPKEEKPNYQKDAQKDIFKALQSLEKYKK